MTRSRFHPTHFLPDSHWHTGFEEIQQRIAGWVTEADAAEAAGDHSRAAFRRQSARAHGYAQYEHMRQLYADLAFQHYVDEHWAWNGESKELRYIVDGYKDRQNTMTMTDAMPASQVVHGDIIVDVEDYLIAGKVVYVRHDREGYSAIGVDGHFIRIKSTRLVTVEVDSPVGGE
jgi:hypothetical protein